MQTCPSGQKKNQNNLKTQHQKTQQTQQIQKSPPQHKIEQKQNVFYQPSSIAQELSPTTNKFNQQIKNQSNNSSKENSTLSFMADNSEIFEKQNNITVEKLSDQETTSQKDNTNCNGIKQQEDKNCSLMKLKLNTITSDVFCKKKEILKPSYQQEEDKSIETARFNKEFTNSSKSNKNNKSSNSSQSNVIGLPETPTKKIKKQNSNNQSQENSDSIVINISIPEKNQVTDSITNCVPYFAKKKVLALLPKKTPGIQKHSSKEELKEQAQSINDCFRQLKTEMPKTEEEAKYNTDQFSKLFAKKKIGQQQQQTKKQQSPLKKTLMKGTQRDIKPKIPVTNLELSSQKSEDFSQSNGSLGNSVHKENNNISTLSSELQQSGQSLNQSISSKTSKNSNIKNKTISNNIQVTQFNISINPTGKKNEKTTEPIKQQKQLMNKNDNKKRNSSKEKKKDEINKNKYKSGEKQIENRKQMKMVNQKEPELQTSDLSLNKNSTHNFNSIIQYKQSNNLFNLSTKNIAIGQNNLLQSPGITNSESTAQQTSSAKSKTHFKQSSAQACKHFS